MVDTFGRVEILVALYCLLLLHSVIPCTKWICDNEPFMSMDWFELMDCSVLTA